MNPEDHMHRTFTKQIAEPLNDACCNQRSTAGICQIMKPSSLVLSSARHRRHSCISKTLHRELPSRNSFECERSDHLLEGISSATVVCAGISAWICTQGFLCTQSLM